MRQVNEAKPWDVVHESRTEDVLSEDLLMRVHKIMVEDVDRECYVWLDEKLLAMTPQQAQQLADEFQEFQVGRASTPGEVVYGRAQKYHTRKDGDFAYREYGIAETNPGYRRISSLSTPQLLS